MDTNSQRGFIANLQSSRTTQALVDDRVNHGDLAEANRRLAALKDHVESEIDDINDAARHAIDHDDFELREVVIPAAQDNAANAPEPLIDSEWDFRLAVPTTHRQQDGV
jgi:hypothetical protein